MKYPQRPSGKALKCSLDAPDLLRLNSHQGAHLQPYWLVWGFCLPSIVSLRSALGSLHSSFAVVFLCWADMGASILVTPTCTYAVVVPVCLVLHRVTW